MQLSLAATIAGDKADDIATAARSDLDRALRFMDAGAFAGVEEEKLTALRVRLRFAEGRPLREISTMFPSSGARDLRLLVLAAPVWRDIEQALDEAMIADLSRGVQELGSETPVLLASALAVAKLRSGDPMAAAQWAHERVAVASEDPVATRIIAQVAAAAESKAAGSSAASATESSKKTDEEASPASLEELLDRGCSLVERGAASSGVTTLLKAFDRDPENLDVMVCLAQGYSRTGRNIRALTFYERVLARSPEHRTALYGAATAAAAQGDHRRASQYYERLLQVVPDHGPAAAYLELHGD